MRDFDDSQVMAYTDGMLDAETADLVAAAAVADPALQNRIDLYRASTRILRDAFDPVLDEPVPARLLRAAGEDPMARAPRRPASSGLLRWGIGLAASIALGVLLLPKVPLIGTPERTIAQVMESDILERQPSGDPKIVTTEGRSVEVLVLATYRTPDGRFCRSYEVVEGSSGPAQRKLGCRGADGGWFAEHTLASAAPGTEVYAPAGGMGVPDTFTAMNFDQEERALRSGWQP